ncbi:acyl-CoA dehydrogenase family protein [Amycolatopsis sp. Poz14]|uniref:acyl-CoA dehydrogenase family protein n=1 Tax=Amycolatopsis sp. Poz14 TaxID=1447705 RepID=UPI001EE92819|nr:acyl-CoA dehydrogenase family protein [Amycolatopsis sp. Poz14]MCG3752001.1 acyl-CoA/acyl-ACP dehydrogenase [Amycolatopsis sp. Poz14]
MNEFDLLPNELEQDLRATVRDLLRDRCSPAEATALYDGDRSLVPGLWKALAGDLGLAGLLISEKHGGHGASAREAAVVLEELGRAVAPVPFLTSSVIATTALADSDAALLGDLAAGTRTAALLVPWSTAPDADLPVLSLDGDRITGTVTSVAGALDADVFLAIADGPALYEVAATDASVTPVVSLDMSRQLADIRLDSAPARLAATDCSHPVRHALEYGAGLLAAEQVGLARWCLETTVEYLKMRRQFGRVVGGFQAVKHRLADLYTSVESAAAAAQYAAVALATDDPDAPVAAVVAQAYCGDAAVVAAEEAVQLHGGIGMTWEHPAHLYLKRAKSDQIALGTSGAHRSRLSALVDLPA